MKNNNDLEIINNLKKDLIEVEVLTMKSKISYKKELDFEYLTKGSLLEKNFKESDRYVRDKNKFWYIGDEKEIDKMAKKDPMEIFEFLAQKHLERNKGYKRFQTPCWTCNQKTLTTLGWSEEGYPKNLERFFCRLCVTSFGWIDIKDDPIELQEEMRGYYKTFELRKIEENLKNLGELSKKAESIKNNLEKNIEFLSKGTIKSG